MLKIFKLGFKNMWTKKKKKPNKHVNQEIPDVQAGFRNGRETRDEIVNNY